MNNGARHAAAAVGSVWAVQQPYLLWGQDVAGASVCAAPPAAGMDVPVYVMTFVL